MQVQVPDPYASTEEPVNDEDEVTVEEGLPAVSLLATLSVALLGAAVVNNRKKQ